MSCSLPSGGITGPFFFEGTFTSNSYLQMLQEKITSCINETYSNAMKCHFQHIGVPPHFCNSVGDFLHPHLPRWVDAEDVRNIHLITFTQHLYTFTAGELTP
jgi:hypothetical protein